MTAWQRIIAPRLEPLLLVQVAESSELFEKLLVCLGARGLSLIPDTPGGDGLQRKPVSKVVGEDLGADPAVEVLRYRPTERVENRRSDVQSVDLSRLA